MNYKSLLDKHKSLDVLSKQIAGLKYGSDVVFFNEKIHLKVSAKIKSNKNSKEITFCKFFEIKLQPLELPKILDIEQLITQSIKEYYDK
jgi:hypothetical protein